MMPGIAPVIGGAQAGTFITAGTVVSEGVTYYGYAAAGYFSENKTGSIKVGKDDPWAIYVLAVLNVSVGGTIGFQIDLDGNRTVLVYGKQIYLNGEIVPDGYAQGPWGYDSQSNRTIRVYILPSLRITHGNTYLVEIK